MKIMRALALTITLLPLWLLARGQTLAHAQPAPACAPAAIQMSGATGQLVGAQNSFGFRLFDRLASQNAGQNTFLSPTSAALALDMVFAGAQSTTEQQMAATLGLQGLTQQQVAKGAASLLTSLHSGDPKVSLQIANALWMNRQIPPVQSFVQNAATNYGATVKDADFTSPETPKAINQWVSCETHGMIKQIVSSLSPYDLLVLLNTVYFKGLWTVPFQPQNTHPMQFTTASGQGVQVPFMHETTNLHYLQGTHFQAVSLPYGNGRFAMDIILPDKGISLQSFMSGLTVEGWQSWFARLPKRQAQVALALPRFTINNILPLKAELGALGMPRAFTKNAEFGGMCRVRCRLTDVRQKTYLKVYESGTVAAAATSVIVGTTAMPAQPVQMVVDHPFLLSIRDSQTGSVLFVGAINNPLR